ncbi:Fur family transcriptional regulator [Rubeoparvulum massiliense]|uniref:Fur family transcriptional regulator n=1 Tax=Rubeoparvulum massiliense TaxID=1631346 RepID=UPI00065DC7F3|nr:Fur family transcriptional regulator [Rubeoparvulum massiliense]
MTVDEAMKRLKEEGFKDTERRREILAIVSSAHRYISAREIYEVMREKNPGMSLDTVYRNLSTFVEFHILEETTLDDERKFRFACNPSLHHHHHYICLGCGITKIVDVCPMENALINEVEDFQITSHKFEIYGYCKACQEKGNQQEKCNQSDK